MEMEAWILEDNHNCWKQIATLPPTTNHMIEHGYALKFKLFSSKNQSTIGTLDMCSLIGVHYFSPAYYRFKIKN